MSTNKPAEYRFLDRQRVRWAEVDAQKIVFNGHYLTYFDTAVSGYWRALGLPYFDTLHALGGDMYAKKATVEWHASARYDDLIDTGMRVARIGNSSVLFEGCVFRHAEPLVSCELVYVYADPATQTSRALPQALRDVFAAFEAGSAMVTPSVGTWREQAEPTLALRREVFGGEFGAAAAADADAQDADALHAVLRNRLGAPLGCARLVCGEGDDAAAGRIGRMAIRQPVRGAGFGTLLLDALVDAARARGLRMLRAAAHDDAVGFYRRAGFVAAGAPTREGPFVRQELQRAL
jgi:YbgC/YbaW family acyl-CoA thioester hydrolase